MPEVNLTCLQTQTIPPGGVVTLPAGAVLVFYNEGGAITSDCDAVQAQIDDADTSSSCYKLDWHLEYDSGGGTSAWSVGDVKIKRIGFGNLVYNVDINANGNTNPAAPNSVFQSTELTAKIQELFPFILYAQQARLTTFSERAEFRLELMIPDVIAQAFFIEVGWKTEPANFNRHKIFAEQCTTCCAGAAGVST